MWSPKVRADVVLADVRAASKHEREHQRLDGVRHVSHLEAQYALSFEKDDAQERCWPQGWHPSIEGLHRHPNGLAYGASAAIRDGNGGAGLTAEEAIMLARANTSQPFRKSEVDIRTKRHAVSFWSEAWNMSEEDVRKLTAPPLPAEPGYDGPASINVESIHSSLRSAPNVARDKAINKLLADVVPMAERLMHWDKLELSQCLHLAEADMNGQEALAALRRVTQAFYESIRSHQNTVRTMVDSVAQIVTKPQPKVGSTSASLITPAFAADRLEAEAYGLVHTGRAKAPAASKKSWEKTSDEAPEEASSPRSPGGWTTPGQHKSGKKRPGSEKPKPQSGKKRNSSPLRQEAKKGKWQKSTGSSPKQRDPTDSRPAEGGEAAAAATTAAAAAKRLSDPGSKPKPKASPKNAPGQSKSKAGKQGKPKPKAGGAASRR